MCGYAAVKQVTSFADALNENSVPTVGAPPCVGTARVQAAKSGVTSSRNMPNGMDCFLSFLMVGSQQGKLT